MGILLGAELYTIALVVVAGISIAMLALAFFRLRSPNTFLLVVHYDSEVENEVMEFVRPHQGAAPAQQDGESRRRGVDGGSAAA